MYEASDISLNVLDQIPIRKEGSASNALNETINLAAVSYTHLTLPTILRV